MTNQDRSRYGNVYFFLCVQDGSTSVLYAVTRVRAREFMANCEETHGELFGQKVVETPDIFSTDRLLHVHKMKPVLHHCAVQDVT